MNLTLFFETLLGASAGVTIIAIAIFQSLTLKALDRLRPGDLVVHTEDDSEPYWTVERVRFSGLTLAGPNGHTKYMRVRDYRLLNKVDGAIWAEVEIALVMYQSERNASRLVVGAYCIPKGCITRLELELESLEAVIADTVKKAASVFLKDTKSIIILLDNLESAHTFTIKFEITSYADKRQAESVVRRALLPLFQFSDRAAISSNLNATQNVVVKPVPQVALPELPEAN